MPNATSRKVLYNCKEFTKLSEALEKVGEYSGDRIISFFDIEDDKFTDQNIDNVLQSDVLRVFKSHKKFFNTKNYTAQHFYRVIKSLCNSPLHNMRNCSTFQPVNNNNTSSDSDGHSDNNRHNNIETQLFTKHLKGQYRRLPTNDKFIIPTLDKSIVNAINKVSKNKRTELKKTHKTAIKNIFVKYIGNFFSGKTIPIPIVTIFAWQFADKYGDRLGYTQAYHLIERLLTSSVHSQNWVNKNKIKNRVNKSKSKSVKSKKTRKIIRTKKSIKSINRNNDNHNKMKVTDNNEDINEFSEEDFPDYNSDDTEIYSYRENSDSGFLSATPQSNSATRSTTPAIESQEESDKDVQAVKLNLSPEILFSSDSDTSDEEEDNNLMKTSSSVENYFFAQTLDSDEVNMTEAEWYDYNYQLSDEYYALKHHMGAFPVESNFMYSSGDDISIESFDYTKSQNNWSRRPI